MMHDLVVVGGGAAGFFGAINLAEQVPDARIVILEKSADVLSKVRISGGGRCNVTHACFEPREMVKHYPRGEKELLGPFHRFLCGDMMAWLEDRGVPVAVEEDGRVFPRSNSSETIIRLFQNRCRELGIEVRTQCGVTRLQPVEGGWKITTRDGDFSARHVLYATGSTPSAMQILEELGLETVAPVPSLFTFNLVGKSLEDLQGLSVPMAEVSVVDSGLVARGPLLITHWGLSGPAILRLSAWGARDLHALGYAFSIEVNWTGQPVGQVEGRMQTIRQQSGKKAVKNEMLEGFPRRLWERLVQPWAEKRWADLTKAELEVLLAVLTRQRFDVKGKSTFKDEFVTAGGVDLREVDFKTFEARRFPGLFLAGEVLNIDGITGGFNFQAAWTGTWLAAAGMASKW